MNEHGEITRLLGELAESDSRGRSQLLDRLMPLVYTELKSLARSNRYRWNADDRPGTTSLVHEAYIRLTHGAGSGYASRGQFFSLASKAMRSILIDNARWHLRQKRGGSAKRVSTDDVELVSAERSGDLLALDEALARLEDGKPELARIVECRVFGGLTVEESAEALELSASTVKRRWSVARLWLYRELKGAEPGREGSLPT